MTDCHTATTTGVECDNCGRLFTVDKRYADEATTCDDCRDAELRERMLRAFETGRDATFSRTYVARAFERDAREGKCDLPARLPESGDILLEVDTVDAPNGTAIGHEKRLTTEECDCGCDDAMYEWDAGRYGEWSKTLECMACGHMHIDEWAAP